MRPSPPFSLLRQPLRVAATRRLLALAGASWLVLLAAPATGSVPEVVGRLRTVTVASGDTLVDIAYAHRVGFEALARLNPGVEVWVPEPGVQVKLPTRAVLPDTPPTGLVVNVPEMRLYHFGDGPVRIFAVAVGDAADPTPDGTFRVGSKRMHPHWHVPSSIRAERPELPAVVPPGPENPLGSRWMTVGSSTYGIHGTDLPWSIGRQATHGCIRLYDDEVRTLYDRVRPGTPLLIVYQSVKLGRAGHRLYLEVHPDLYLREPDRLDRLLERLRALDLARAPTRAKLERVIAAEQGVPVPIGELRDGSEVASR